MSEATRPRNSHNNKPNAKLTLIELLDEEQPYKNFGQLDDRQMETSKDDIKTDKLRRIQGSLVGLAIGDAIGAPVEFRPHAYLQEHQVSDMQSGGTWGLEKGQWTDDTSMALCLAASLVVKGKFNAYDQFLRYKRWYRDGYLSSTGKCFDIGKSTRDAITAFETRWQKVRSEIKQKYKNSDDPHLDSSIEAEMRNSKKGLKFGTEDSAGNGPLMRLAPIPCFFSDSYDDVKSNMDEATQLTHGDKKAIDACQFYAGLIWHALQGISKKELLQPNFYKTLGLNPLHAEVKEVAEGSYKGKKGYEDGIRGKGYVVQSMEAALWAFHNDDGNFQKGVLLAVNLGDDTDTTAAIYGQLAGAVYGIDQIPQNWIDALYEGEFIMTIAKGLYIGGAKSRKNQQKSTWSDEDNTNFSEGRASGTSGTQHDQYSDATKNTSNSPQKTRTNETSNQNNTGDNSGTNRPSSSGSHPHLFYDS